MAIGPGFHAKPSPTLRSLPSGLQAWACFFDVSCFPPVLILLIWEKNKHTYIAMGPAPHWFFCENWRGKTQAWRWFQTRNRKGRCVLRLWSLCYRIKVCQPEWECLVCPILWPWLWCVHFHVRRERDRNLQALCSFWHFMFFFTARPHWLEEKKNEQRRKTTPRLTQTNVYPNLYKNQTTSQARLNFSTVKPALNDHRLRCPETLLFPMKTQISFFSL